jgi:hypothetical protein
MISQAFRRNAISLALSFGMLVLSYLCIQQAQTIASQRTLIRSLFQDSLELNSIKVKHLQDLSKH